LELLYVVPINEDARAAENIRNHLPVQTVDQFRGADQSPGNNAE
jgi:hypothetical protein